MPNLLTYDYEYLFPDLLEYVGPVTYNAFDKHFYFYTSEGFFRLDKSLFGKYSKTLMIKPGLLWQSGQKAAIGYRMNVIDFQFVAKKSFLFLMEKRVGFYNNGIITWFI
ncbi:hypothetical protein [Flavobacterium psychrotrophum]|uniref:hypothetical protein n=1 Tax=Flavobacterium psychrotrophum TaxID=2294119 RepID=UPI0013C4FDEF|nr:hypothetical protein [Flavobacterium psychrotrophum]